MPSIDIVASIKPKKFEPESPINVLAGLKLYGKNPISPPSNATVSIYTEGVAPFNIKIINIENVEIAETQVASPSSPSIKLSAFVTPIIQQKVIIIDTISFNPYIYKNGTLKKKIVIPLAITQIAATACPNNFIQGFNPNASSKKPVDAIIATPIKNPNKFTSLPSCVVAKINKQESKNAIINASPPILGIG